MLVSVDVALPILMWSPIIIFMVLAIAIIVDAFRAKPKPYPIFDAVAQVPGLSTLTPGFTTERTTLPGAPMNAASVAKFSARPAPHFFSALQRVAAILLAVLLVGCSSARNATYSPSDQPAANHVVVKRAEKPVSSDPDGRVRHQMRHDPTQSD